MPRVLIADDDPDLLAGLAMAVGREGFTVATASSLAEARQEIEKETPDILLLDLLLPDGSGLDLLGEVVGTLRTEVVMISGQARIDQAVEAMRRGAANFLVKPVELAYVKSVLVSAMRKRALDDELGALRGELRKLGRFGLLVGAAPAMQKLYDHVAKVAATDATVFLVGETGTGKELVAQTIHALSPRRDQPFVALNCGAMASSLVESELFGHERGSFTGADRKHHGAFERAHRGTVFLDEITETPEELQVKLLRVLESRTLTRVGGTESMTTDVRVIAATNRPVGEAVEQGKLRKDLHYRLNVFPIRLPPLRERIEDIPLLANHFLSQLNEEQGTSKTLTPAALDRLCTLSWPGNVRELKNVLHRAYILAEEEIGLECLPVAGEGMGGSAINVKVGTSLAEAERKLILATMEHCAGEKKRAAEILGVSVKTIYNRLDTYRTEAS